MAGPQASFSASLKHDKFSSLKRSSTHNACWGSSSSSSSSTAFSTHQGTRELHDQPEWPLAISLKERTRQALFREFGLADRPRSHDTTRSTGRRLRKNTSSSRMLALSSSKQLLQRVESRMYRTSPCLDAKSFSSPNCGGLRRSCHLAAIRPTTVVALQPTKRSSLFRQAIKQQQS